MPFSGRRAAQISKYMDIQDMPASDAKNKALADFESAAKRGGRVMAHADYDRDQFDTIRTEDLKNLAGAYCVGKVTDTQATRIESYGQGPSDAVLGLTVDVDTLWMPAVKLPTSLTDMRVYAATHRDHVRMLHNRRDTTELDVIKDMRTYAEFGGVLQAKLGERAGSNITVRTTPFSAPPPTLTTASTVQTSVYVETPAAPAPFAIRAAPTAVPTAAPDAAPTAAPDAAPTAAPDAAPDAAPTAAPTAAPDAAPTAAAAPAVRTAHPPASRVPPPTSARSIMNASIAGRSESTLPERDSARPRASKAPLGAAAAGRPAPSAVRSGPSTVDEVFDSIFGSVGVRPQEPTEGSEGGAAQPKSVRRSRAPQ